MYTRRTRNLHEIIASVYLHLFSQYWFGIMIWLREFHSDERQCCENKVRNFPPCYARWISFMNYEFLLILRDSFSDGNAPNCVLRQVLSPTCPGRGYLSGGTQLLNLYSDGLRAERPGFYSRRCKIFLYFTEWSIYLLSNEYWGKAVGKWSWPLTSTLCRNQEWCNYTSTPPYIFMERTFYHTHGMRKCCDPETMPPLRNNCTAIIKCNKEKRCPI
jgi:hypothetical protein